VTASECPPASAQRCIDTPLPRGLLDKISCTEIQS
jgi:hypothetical protein